MYYINVKVFISFLDASQGLTNEIRKYTIQDVK